MEGFKAAETEESGVDSGAAFEELRKRFLEGSPEEAQDAFAGLLALTDEDAPAGDTGKKPGLHILIGK